MSVLQMKERYFTMATKLANISLSTKYDSRKTSSSTGRLLRKILDNDAVYIYKHWVKRGDGQNMAAFFDNKPKVEAARKKRREAEAKDKERESSAEVKVDDDE